MRGQGHTDGRIRVRWNVAVRCVWIRVERRPGEAHPGSGVEGERGDARTAQGRRGREGGGRQHHVVGWAKLQGLQAFGLLRPCGGGRERLRWTGPTRLKEVKRGVGGPLRV